MSLHNDIDPLPSNGVKKIKKLYQSYSKIKPKTILIRNKTANAFFLLRTASNKCLVVSVGMFNSIQKAISNFFTLIKPYISHMAIFAVAFLVVVSNLIVKYAKADYTVSYPNPTSEISFAASADIFTPNIENDGMGAEKAYQNSSDAFLAFSNSVDTTITQRVEPLPDNSESTVYYEVRNGDSLTAIGWQFNVKLATLMYINDIDNANLVKPGQKLKIPPKGYEVSSSAIAKKENEKQQKLASSKKNSSSSSASKIKINSAAGSSKNGYPYGYCTYYVATRRYVPSNWGNAKNWLNSAKRSGYSTGARPVVGSIGVTPESWWGHVVYVESVNGDSVTFSEMNAVGWGKTSRRTLPVSSFRGFIY